MPTYEFRCPEGHEFEKFYRSIGTAESAAACPTCGKAAERMMSATGFAFKGSGFYLTDYGKNAHRGEAPPSASGGETASKDAAPKDGGSKDSGAKEGGESSKSAPASDGGGAAASKSEASAGSEKKAEPKAEAKPAAPPSKPSAGE
ncbi:MAG: zinc ribbon domain-containing protein [Gemmatimonadota bacterium]